MRSSVFATRRPTFLTAAGTARPNAPAVVDRPQRGVLWKKFKPMKAAPLSTAALTVSGVFRPQILAKTMSDRLARNRGKRDQHGELDGDRDEIDDRRGQQIGHRRQARRPVIEKTGGDDLLPNHRRDLDREHGDHQLETLAGGAAPREAEADRRVDGNAIQVGERRRSTRPRPEGP